MKIEDEAWLQSFQAGREPDAKPGAWLDVVMHITQPRDRTQPAAYVVSSVNKVLPREESPSLFDSEEAAT
jgi:hypothetical protein